MEGKKLVIGNLKMNFDLEELSIYLKELNSYNLNKQLIVCPTSIYVPYFLNKKYQVGLQNTFMHEKGAYTGEISPKQAASMGITYTILGHSERRMYLDESDSFINKKVLEALKFNLNVIFCIGETTEERNMLKTDKILKRQIINGLRGVDDKIENVIIAYEPRWAIGTFTTPTVNEIRDIAIYIRDLINKLYKTSNIRVLYGGSVNEKNIEEINRIKDIDGVLVGTATLDVNKFMKIIEVVVNQ